MWVREGEKHKRIVYLGDQRSDEWAKLRKYRLTGSRAGSALGRGYKSAKQTADVICGRAVEPINDSMLRGITKEPEVKEWYEKEDDVKIRDIGFAYLEEHPQLGVSPDGLVGEDGMIEIKCPDKMYWKLRGRAKGYKEKKNEHGGPDHIFASHYDQMQMQMAVMERHWCDYVVVSFAEDEVYRERVPFNQVYWDKMLKDLLEYCEKYLVLEDEDQQPWCVDLKD